MVYDMSNSEIKGTFNRDIDLPRRYTWRSWHSMTRRCRDLKHVCSKNYGRKGIKVCDRWLNFDNFLADMGFRPKDHIISRQDHTKDYSKDNCLWEHRSLSGRNRRTEIPITINGVTRCLEDWSRISGVAAGTIRRRLRSGWEPDKLLTSGPGQYALRKEPAEDLMAAILRGVNVEGGNVPIRVDDETWSRIQRFIKASQFLLLS